MHLKNYEVSHLSVADDITELVGGTPMLRLKRLVPAGSADIFAKLEYLNPGGSVKDRAAIGIIRRAEQFVSQALVLLGLAEVGHFVESRLGANDFH